VVFGGGGGDKYQNNYVQTLYVASLGREYLFDNLRPLGIKSICSLFRNLANLLYL